MRRVCASVRLCARVSVKACGSVHACVNRERERERESESESEREVCSVQRSVVTPHGQAASEAYRERERG